MADKPVTYTKDGTAFVKDNTGAISRLDADKAAALLADPNESYLPATEADVKYERRKEENNSVGGKAKTFAESAAAGAIDAAQAPLVAPYRLGRALLGVEGPDPTQDISGRKTIENLATIYGNLREGSTGKTGEAYGHEYAENARGRAEDNPTTSLLGQGVGALATGGALSGAAKAGGLAVTEGLAAKGASALVSKGAGLATTGALEGAAYGSMGASEEAYLKDIPLTGEKVIASMGLGAILGGGISMGMGAAGGVLRRGLSRSAEAVESGVEAAGADLGAETGAKTGAAKSSFADSLRDFADERTAKSMGARATDLKKLGRTAEEAREEISNMSRTVREMKLEDGTPVFKAIQSQEELADRLLQAKNETGEKLAAFRDKADKVFDSHPELAPDPKSIADRIRGEIADPLANHPLTAARSQAAPIVQLADDIEKLGSKAANDNGAGAGISDLTRLRKGLDDQIYQQKRGVNLAQQGAPPNLKDLEKARGILEESIEAATDKASQHFDDAATQSYKEIKTQWRQLNLASDISGAASLQDLGNRVVSPSDYAAGAAAMIGDMASGGAVSMIKGAMAAVGHKAIREHASSVLAVLADKLANTLDGKIEQGLGGFFKEASERAQLGAIGKKVGEVASAVPIRRAFVPSAVQAFTGRSKDLGTAYQNRVDELIAANRDNGAGTRGRVRDAMGGAFEAMPRLSAAATMTATRGAQYLESQLPGGTRAPTVFEPNKRTVPSDLEIRTFAQKWAAVSNPLSVLDDLRKGQVTHAQIDAVKAVYPGLYQQIQQHALDKIRELDKQGKRMPLQDRLQIDLFLDLGGAGEPTLSGRFIDRVSGLQAAKQAQQKQPHGSSAALGHLSESAAPGSSVLSGK